jgi:hypothetical protein
MEHKKGGLLKSWIDRSVTSGITELRSFAKGLLIDFEAVKMPYNTLEQWCGGRTNQQTKDYQEVVVLTGKF